MTKPGMTRSGKPAVDHPERRRRRPHETPKVRIREFPYEDEAWLHPGMEDVGQVYRLFNEMDEWFPDELHTDTRWRFLPPTAEQVVEADRVSGSELYVGIEQYLKGLAPDRAWADERMQAIYVEYLDRSLTGEEMAYICGYAIEEHGV